ncbi:MAG: polysaccharide biosynthesis/export family protein [Deltaproteobacteria bacterium]|nr:polysaccharide biosynthesis/export family protein [Deltaproteobacteria bacterium]
MLVNRYYSPLLIFLMSCGLVFLISSCSSSTAVKGTPVKELKLTEGKRIVAEVVSQEDREAVARLSQVKENAVFKEIRGVSEYRVGPLDVLEINSYIGDKMNTTSVTVNSRGAISYSFIDDLAAAGLTPSELDREITEGLSSYIRNPRIDVLIKEFNSKSAMVLGEFASLQTTYYMQAGSGRIPLKGRMTLLDLIAEARGYTVDADIKNTKLIRGGQTYMINLFDIIEKGDLSQNVVIDDGDTVEIPELPQFGERVYVLGEVAKQGIYPLKDAKDLLAAVSLAGSFTRFAKEENTLVMRGYGPDKEPLVMMSDLKALLREADLGQNVHLEDGDLVYVPRMKIGDVNDWVENIKPILDILLWPGEFDRYYSDDETLFAF